jgi:hypothetical protein
LRSLIVNGYLLEQENDTDVERQRPPGSID